MGNNDKPLGMSGDVPAGELLPCPNPWCASHRRSETREAYAPYVKLFIGGYYRVTCAVCPQIGPSKREADEAITAWNTRATPTPPIEGRDADVEAMAKAWWDREQQIIWEGGLEPIDWGKTAVSVRAAYKDCARAALQALGERG